MGLLEIVVGLILLLFLFVMGLMMNPPEALVRRLTGEDRPDKKNTRL